MGGWSLLPRKRDRQTGRLLRACLAELFGTFSLVFWGCGAAAHGAASTATHISFAFGFGIATAVHIFSDISGAHLNPAISLALFVAQRISVVRCFFYWIMQFLGGALAAAIWFLLNGKVPGLVSLREADVALNVDAISPWQGLLLEVFGTLMLVYLVLAATNEARDMRTSSYEVPLAVGICVFVVHLVLVPLTGCGINPVRGLMPSVIADDVRSYHWIYVVGPLIASIIGAFTYELIFSIHYKPGYVAKDNGNMVLRNNIAHS